MTERELQRAVLGLAATHHWRAVHFLPARSMRDGRAFLTAQQGDKGFPDLVLLRPPRLIFAELKSDRGRVDFDQATWLNSLGTVAGVEDYVWRPRDWPDAVEAALK